MYTLKACCRLSSCCSLRLSELIWVWSSMNFSAGIGQSGLWNQFCKNEVVAIVHTSAIELCDSQSLSASQLQTHGACPAQGELKHRCPQKTPCQNLSVSVVAGKVGFCMTESKFFVSRKTDLVMFGEHCAHWNESKSADQVCKEDLCGCEKCIWGLETYFLR